MEVGTSEAGCSKTTEDVMEEICEGPISVLEQAARDDELYPESSNFLLGRMFGAPGMRQRPCRTCCGLNFAPIPKKGTKEGDEKATFLGWTAHEYENMTDTCSAHYVNSIMEERAKAKAALEARLAKQMRAEKAKKAKIAREEKKNGIVRKSKSPISKEAKKAKAEKEKIEIKEEDIDDYLFESMAPKKKKTIRWVCPECKKSSKFGSCGCVECGEWYHISCAGFKKGNEVPKKWTCVYCQ